MNKLFFHPHCVLYIGESFDTVLHRHHSVQITIGVSECLSLFNADDELLNARGVIVPANYAHKLKASNTSIATLFIDVQSLFYQQLRLGCKHIDFNTFQEVFLSDDSLLALSSLAAIKSPTASCTDKSEVCAESVIGKIINDLTIKGFCSPLVDERIVKVLKQLDSTKDSQIALDELAQSVHLSTSRLAHLFKAQVGIPIRRYSLWRRIRYAIEYAHQQQSLTQGAHFAGFADSAHLSRVFKEMFGINPSLIINQKAPLQLFFL